MIEINGYWEFANTLQNISEIIRRHYNNDLADAMDELLEDYENKVEFAEERADEIEELEDDISRLEDTMDSIRRMIERSKFEDTDDINYLRDTIEDIYDLVV